jgi:hypothetical protein
MRNSSTEHRRAYCLISSRQESYLSGSFSLRTQLVREEPAFNPVDLFRAISLAQALPRPNLIIEQHARRCAPNVVGRQAVPKLLRVSTHAVTRVEMQLNFSNPLNPLLKPSIHCSNPSIHCSTPPIHFLDPLNPLLKPHNPLLKPLNPLLKSLIVSQGISSRGISEGNLPRFIADAHYR